MDSSLSFWALADEELVALAKKAEDSKATEQMRKGMKLPRKHVKPAFPPDMLSQRYPKSSICSPEPG